MGEKARKLVKEGEREGERDEERREKERRGEKYQSETGNWQLLYSYHFILLIIYS